MKRATFRHVTEDGYMAESHLVICRATRWRVEPESRTGRYSTVRLGPWIFGLAIDSPKRASPRMPGESGKNYINRVAAGMNRGCN